MNVYQFEFPQTSYTTTVGGTLASGTQASGYAHIQNATGLPTDGFTYKWNNAATGTNDANWAAMNKPILHKSLMQNMMSSIMDIHLQHLYQRSL